MIPLLRRVLARIVKTGNLWVHTESATPDRFGDGTGPPRVIRIADRRTQWHLVVDPELAFGEAYMSGRLTVVSGTLYDVIALLMENIAATPLPRYARGVEFLRRAVRTLLYYNPRTRALANARHHYDVDPRIYDLFLDSDRQYSCAYFASADHDLEAAQRAKKRHIAAKLALGPGMTVCDIGSGWGGLAIYLASVAGANVLGVTLSERQLAASQQSALANGRSGTVHFERRDYRDITGVYDRVVSVGMLEHVGTGQYDAYFGKIAEILADDGVALVHTIARIDDARGITNPFIVRYIFPGGYVPALSELAPSIERARLVVTDIEVLRLHYAQTLRAWRTRFLARREEAEHIAGAEFCRMWEAYLAGSEAAFRYQNLVVLQIQLTRRLDAVPLTRDYIAAAEDRLARQERSAKITRIAGE